MKKYRNWIFYTSVVGIFSLITYLFLHLGRENSTPENRLPFTSENTAWSNFIVNLLDNIVEPMAILLMQIVIILIIVRICGWLCQKIGQPTVVGEIIAGVILGPSLLGHYFPDAFAFVFPDSSMGNIRFLSQIGLILFMFIVGMELDFKVVKNKADDALIISHSSIAVPFSFGVILAYFLNENYTHETTEFIPFALFMGIAMSIAAFPVMARIVHERGINKTPLGQQIITCAAIDDITAWCLLAAVIAITKAGSFTSSLFVFLMAFIYIIVMFKVIRPLLQYLADIQPSKKNISKSTIGVFFIVLFLSAYTTEVIGIHALFGAFLAGVIMPSNMSFRNLFSEKIEDVSLILLLPLFFVFTGLRTQIGLLNDPYLWGICLIIILLAVSGKFFGSAIAARFIGNTWKDSLTIGALMNTRGLMELVVLNIGLDLGILTNEVFAMMVVMALTTTFMTSPLLNLIERIFKNKSKGTELEEIKKYKILVSFKDSLMGRKLLLVANSFIRKRQAQSELTMLHLSQGDVLYQFGLDEEEADIFSPVIKEAKSLNQDIIPVFKIANNTHVNVAKIANKGEYDFLIIGYRGSILDNTFLSRMLGFSNRLIETPRYILSRFGMLKKWSRFVSTSIDEGTRTIVSKSDIPVGIFIDRGLVNIKNVFVPILDEEDVFVGDFMKRLAENSYVRITLWDYQGLIEQSIEFVNSVQSIKSINPYLFQLWNNNIPIDSDILKRQDLMLVSISSWKKLQEKDYFWLKDVPSTLILVNN